MKIRSKFKFSLGQIIGGLIIILLAIFFIRTALWENSYYAEKEGSARDLPVTNLSADESSVADETPVTEEQIISYTVPTTNPRYLTIAKLGITKARILSLGTTASGAFATPNGIYDAGWYNQSSTPGAGGTILLDGHNGGPTKSGIFKHLPDLVEGDTISIERGDGTVFHYSVTDNTEVSLADSHNYMYTAMRSPIYGRESVTIISCSGEWDRAARTYASRQFVRAVRITE